jgi:DnaJ family protein B protein 13
MARPDGEIVNLAHACRVLDVPWDASPRAIKDSYRELVKRWHPDRQPPDTEPHTDSTLMTRLLNEAYARIQDAPLRNGFSAPLSAGRASRSGAGSEANGDASGAAREEHIPRDSPLDAAEYYRITENARREGAREDAARPFDWLGFAVRFVVGALFGGL